MEYEAREETRADERDAEMATEAILPLAEENIAFDQFNCADLEVQVRSTDEVAKREFGGLAKLGAAHYGTNQRPCISSAFFSLPHNIILSFFILCRFHFCKHCLTDISLTRHIPELPIIFFFAFSKLHNAHNTREAVQDNVFAALDHEGILNPHHTLLRNNT